MVFVVTRGEPAIPRPDARAERMRRFVQSSVLEPEPDGCCRLSRKGSLRVLGIVPAEYRSVGPHRRLANCLHQGNEVLPQAGKDLGDVARLGSWLIIIKQRVVEDARAAPQGACLFALEGNDLLEPGSKRLEVRLFPRSTQWCCASDVTREISSTSRVGSFVERS